MMAVWGNGLHLFFLFLMGVYIYPLGSKIYDSHNSKREIGGSVGSAPACYGSSLGSNPDRNTYTKLAT